MKPVVRLARRRPLCALPLLALVGVGCGPHPPGLRGPVTAAAPHPGAAVVRSNITRADYAGSAACAGCHPRVYAAWNDSPMRRMTRLPAQAQVRAPFDGGSFRFKNDRATFQQRGPERYLRVQSPLFGDHLYRVTKVIGGRYREDFAGLEVADTTPGARVLGDPAAELVLPVSYVFASGSFRLKGYSVMVGERPGLRAGGVWNQTCISCHNTVPQFLHDWSALHGAGAPAHQSVLVDRLLPADRRTVLHITDRPALDQSLRDEIQALGGAASAGATTTDLLAEAARTSHDRLAESNLIEVGIGCEACHGGSREHVDDPLVLPTFEPRSPFLSVSLPGPGPARAGWINRTCARCHQVLFSRYPYTWEGGQRRHDPGGSSINSGEARDFLLGGCARQMACTTCHDPHAPDRPEALRALATPAGNRVCTTCHQGLDQPASLRQHAHHDPAGAGGACIACHMPRKNAGLGYELTRYHRIGSPTDRARVEQDRPLECALCHPRASAGSLVSAMERFWGKRYDRSALLRLYGDLGAPVLDATAARGRPHEQLTAVAALGEARVSTAVPAVAAALAHPYPLVRHFAARALERLTGRPAPVDLNRPTEEIRAAILRFSPGTTLPPQSPAGDDPTAPDVD